MAQRRYAGPQTTHATRLAQARRSGQVGWAQRGARAARDMAGARLARQPGALRVLGFVVVVGLLALLYLSQVAAVTATHQALLQQQARRSDLQRQDASLRAQLGRVESPAYIEQRAQALGMVPANPATVIWITLHDASATGGAGNAGGAGNTGH